MKPDLRAVIGSGVLAVVLTAASAAVLWPVSGTANALPPLTAVATSTPPRDDAGQQLFQAKGCIGCHSIASRGLHSRFNFAAPDLGALPQVAATRRPQLSADEYVRQSIREPQTFVVPGYPGPMPTLPVAPDEVEALVAFLLAPR